MTSWKTPIENWRHGYSIISAPLYCDGIVYSGTNGKPLIGINEKPVPQEPRQKTAKTQPFPVGDAVVPQCAKPVPGYEGRVGCIFQSFWDEPVLVQPSGIGGTDWSPMSYNPATGLLYVPGTIRCMPHPWMYGEVIVEQ